MARSAGQKLKILYIIEYLMRESDEEHPVTLAQISHYLENREVSAERKSLYSDFDAIREFGIDLQSVRSGSVTGYYIGERRFQLAELKLLVDSVQCSRFITQKKTMELISKLEELISAHDASRLRRQVYVSNRVKTENETIYYAVDAIHNAISSDRRIKFKYFNFDSAKKRRYRRGGGLYEVSPYALLWEDENYYLVAFDAEHRDVRHFRVDKMEGITVTDQPRDGKEELLGTDMAEYVNRRFGMFSGDATAVRMEFDESLAGAVIDRFGSDVMLVPGEAGQFTFTVNVAVNEQFFGWVCGFGSKARILGPAGVVDAMREHLAGIAAMY